MTKTDKKVRQIMDKKKELYAKWYAEYILDGYQQDMLDEMKNIDTIEKAQEALMDILEELNIKEYSQVAALYDTTLADFLDFKNDKEKREAFVRIFNAEMMEDVDDFLETLRVWVSEDDEEYDENNDSDEEASDEVVELFAQGLFVTAQNINVILDHIKKLEYTDGLYDGAKTSDFDNKEQYITYLLEKRLATTDSNDEQHKNIVMLADHEVNDRQESIIDYFKNKYDANQNDDIQELTLTK